MGFQSSPGQVGGGLTGGMFSATAQNPGTAGLDLAQSSIFGQMPGAPTFGGQSPFGSPAGQTGGFLDSLPGLLKNMQGMTAGAPQGGGGNMPRGIQDINQGLSMGSSALSMLAMLGIL